MGFIRRLAWLAAMLALGLNHAQAATPDDGQAARALLERALAYYDDYGDYAFAAFSRQGEFVDKDRYVFVVDTQGVMLASGGPSSALIGRDVSEVLGPDLRKAFKDALKTPQASGIQQAEYRWKNPVTGKVENKHAYLKKAGHLLVAVGYYSP
jgi:hypothetical protein